MLTSGCARTGCRGRVYVRAGRVSGERAGPAWASAQPRGSAAPCPSSSGPSSRTRAARLSVLVAVIDRLRRIVAFRDWSGVRALVRSQLLVSAVDAVVVAQCPVVLGRELVAGLHVQ